MKKNITKSLILMLALVLGFTTMSPTNILNAKEVTADPNADINTDGIEMKKTAVYDPITKDYKITLEAYTKGTLSVTEKSQPLDVVFVLDQSGSMLWDFEGNKVDVAPDKMRKELLKKSTTSVLEQLNEDAVKNNVHHRASFINFGSPGQSSINYSEILSGPSSDVSTQKKAFIDIKDNLNIAKGALSKSLIYPYGDTYSSYGLSGAQGVLKQDEKKDSKKVVIFFTDGIDSQLNNSTVEHDSIMAAKAMKDDGATVFSVAIPAGKYEATEADGPTVSRFLSYISSNYPDAIDMRNSGKVVDNPQYMYQANSEIELGNIFKTIFEIVTKPSVELKNVALKDYMSDYFETPNSGEVKVYQEAYAGNNTWGERTTLGTEDGIKVVVDKNNKEISVTGFDFNKNCVTEAITTTDVTAPASGSKLVVEFHTDKVDGFIGGNNIPTNTSNAGLYTEKGTVIKNFDVPKVNVELDIQAAANDASMYLTTNISAEDASSIIDADISKAGLDYFNAKGEKFSFNGGINNKFVNIEYTVSDKDGKILGVYQLPAGESTGSWTSSITTNQLKNTTDIKVVMKVSPSESIENGIVGKDFQKGSKIHIFKPTVKVENSTVFRGTQYDLAKSNIDLVTWKSATSNTLPSYQAPTLSYNFHAVDNAGNVIGGKVENPKTYYESGKYKVSVVSNTVDITADTKIKNDKPVESADFKVDVVNGEIQLTKKVDQAYSENKDINSNQSFVFRIEVLDPETKKVTETFYQSIDFEASDFTGGSSEKTVTIKGLRAGIYNIQEESNWSWKYNLKDSLTNYKTETNQLYIGEARNGKYPFFGIETGTSVDGVEVGNAGTIEFTNTIKGNINVIGDCGNAINIFKK